MEKLNYYPNYYPSIYFSRDVSETLDQKEKYIKNREFDKVKRSDIDKLSDTLKFRVDLILINGEIIYEW